MSSNTEQLTMMAAKTNDLELASGGAVNSVNDHHWRPSRITITMVAVMTLVMLAPLGALQSQSKAGANHPSPRSLQGLADEEVGLKFPSCYRSYRMTTDENQDYHVPGSWVPDLTNQECASWAAAHTFENYDHLPNAYVWERSWQSPDRGMCLLYYWDKPASHAWEDYYYQDPYYHICSMDPVPKIESAETCSTWCTAWEDYYYQGGGGDSWSKRCMESDHCKGCPSCPGSSTVAAPTAKVECSPLCKAKMHESTPWDDKCKNWVECTGCDECRPAPTLAPTPAPAPAPAPTPAPALCKDWCRARKHENTPWERKCKNWVNCKGCEECGPIQTAAPEAPTTAKCKKWCRAKKHENTPWENKCKKWVNCKGCEECAAVQTAASSSSSDSHADVAQCSAELDTNHGSPVGLGKGNFCYKIKSPSECSKSYIANSKKGFVKQCKWDAAASKCKGGSRKTCRGCTGPPECFMKPETVCRRMEEQEGKCAWISPEPSP